MLIEISKLGLAQTKGEGVPAQSETSALNAAFAAAGMAVLSPTAEDAYNRLIFAAKQCGAFALIDRLYVNVCEVEGQGRFNLKDAVSRLTATNVPTFVPNGGFYSNGTTQLYTTDFTASTATTANYKQNNASLAVYVLDDRSENRDDVGNTNSCIRTRFDLTEPVMPVRLNSAATINPPLPPSKHGAGLAWASRDDANTVRIGKGRDKIFTDTANASSALSTLPMLYGGGRVAGAPNYSNRRLGAMIIGAALTDAMWAALSDAFDTFMATMLTTTLTLDVATTAQVLEGIGIELQADSIEGDGGGIQESNTSSLPLGLSSAEKARFNTQVMGYGAGFVDFRLAMGLYFRGTSADGKRFIERLPGQNAAIKQMVDATGVGVCFTYWSPPPFFKKNTVSSVLYRGSTYARPDPVADPSGYNTWMRRLLQGGSLDAPDKATEPAAYAAWMADFAAQTVAQMEYVHINVGPVRRFVAQNEPTNVAAYPTCLWTNEQMYDFLKAIEGLIAASSVLATYAGQANTVRIVSDDNSGPNGVGGALIRADSALLARIYGWSWHRIDENGYDPNWIIDNAAAILVNAGGKPSYSSENEFFDDRVNPASTKYMMPQHRMASMAMQIAMWMRAIGSPIWYPIHIGKPSTGPVFETEGRAMTIWRPAGAPVRDDYPNLAEGSFDFVKVNWHAIKGFLEHMPRNSVRTTFGASDAHLERELYGFSWRKPDGKHVMCMVNRCRKPNAVKLAGMPAGTYRRFRYDLNTASQDMGTIASGTRFQIPADTIEFVVQQ